MDGVVGEGDRGMRGRGVPCGLGAAREGAQGALEGLRSSRRQSRQSRQSRRGGSAEEEGVESGQDLPDSDLRTPPPC